MLGFDENSKKRESDLCNARQDTALFEKLTKKLASKKAGLLLNHGGLFFKDGGYINPKGICQDMVDHEGIQKNFNEEVHDLIQERDGFRFKTSKNEYILDQVCLCNAYMVEQFI